jgi:hypothetical protein
MKMGRIVFATMIAGASTAAGFLAAQTTSNANTPHSRACSAWVYYPEQTQQPRYDGYLLCPETGELWVVNEVSKRIVREGGRD